MNEQGKPRTGFKFLLSVKSGPDRGSVFQLLPPKVTIGRGEENHVVLADPRVSRNAVEIVFTMEKIAAIDRSTRPALRVNGKPVASASLKDGYLIETGDTVMSFNVEAVPLGGANAMVAQQPFGGSGAPQVSSPMSPSSPALGAAASGAASAAAGMTGMPGMSGRSGGSGRKKQTPVMFYVVSASLLGLLVYIGSSSPNKGDLKVLELPSEEQVKEKIKESEKMALDLPKKVFKSEDDRLNYEEANKHYLTGFRDYQKQQYSRAMRSFETARAIYPQHEQATLYYTLAEKRHNEMISSFLYEGRNYKAKAMYSRCTAAFEKAMDAITNKNDLKYQQAEAAKKECDAYLELRFE